MYTPRINRIGYVSAWALGVFGVALAGCSGSSDEPAPKEESNASVACDAEATVMTTSDGVEFVRTPDSCFDALPDWSFESRYLELDGLRQVVDRIS